MTYSDEGTSVIHDTVTASAAPAANGRLLPHHERMLAGSSIAAELVAGRHYVSVPAAANGEHPGDLLRSLGIPAWARDEATCFPGLLIPLYRATGELVSWQYRPDAAQPDPAKPGKTRRYASVSGHVSVLDVHPSNKGRAADPSVPLVITEGVKKADALASRGMCAVALSGVWNWRSRLGTLGDWEDVALAGRHVIIVYDSDAAANDGVLAAMIRLGRWLKSKGAARVSYVITPELPGMAKTGADDFLAAGHDLGELWAAGTDTPPARDKGPALDPEGWMVQDLAAEALDSRWLWSPALGWLRYEPALGRWKPLGQDKDAAITETVRDWMGGKYREAVAEMSAAAGRGAAGSELKALEQRAAQWRGAASRARITALAALARGLLMRDAEDFDAHPDLLNTPSGVLDTRTGLLGPHDPDLLFTQVTAARYVPGARHPDWDQALEAIPDDVRDWVQLRLGQAVTGRVPPDDGVIIQLGDGENGKTTIVYGCQGALGDYFRTVSERAVIRDKSQHPTELMEFRGARLAVLEELAEDRVLNMRTVKMITGMEITARYCGQDSTTYRTTHSLVISTNHDPVITETDHGSWRRLLVLRYPYRYYLPGKLPADPAPGDRLAAPGLRERMRDGGDGRGEAVLAWLAEGARRWHAEGLGIPPARIEADKEDWRAACNPVFAWVRDTLAPDPGSHVPSAELTAALGLWMAGAGHLRAADKLLDQRLSKAFGELGWRAAKIHVDQRHSRTRLSRPAGRGGGAATGQYKAWEGIRYRTPGDDGGQDTGGSAFGTFGIPGQNPDSPRIHDRAEHPNVPNAAGQGGVAGTGNGVPAPVAAPVPVPAIAATGGCPACAAGSRFHPCGVCGQSHRPHCGG